MLYKQSSKAQVSSAEVERRASRAKAIKNKSSIVKLLVCLGALYSALVLAPLASSWWFSNDGRVAELAARPAATEAGLVGISEMPGPDNGRETIRELEDAGWFVMEESRRDGS